MATRRWEKWAGRFRDESNSTSGFFALAGTGVAALGAVVAAPVVVALGGVTALGFAGWCAIRAIPPRLRAANEVLGRTFDNLKDLDGVHPPLRRVGFVGATQVGKTTLISHLQVQPAAGVRTEAPYATVIQIQGSPTSFFAMIDAAGQTYSQQFKVADESDSLIIFLDHAESHVTPMADPVRLKFHEEFLEQLAGHIKTTGRVPKRIHFLLNKRDLWEGDPSSKALGDWFQAEVSEWKTHSSAALTESVHSNLIAGDITSLVQVLRQWAK